MTVHNIYKQQNSTLEIDQLFASTTDNDVFIGGHFNVHHPLLHSVSPTHEAGEHIAHALEEFPTVKLLNTGEATHTLRGWLDLSLISVHLEQKTNWGVLCTQ